VHCSLTSLCASSRKGVALVSGWDYLINFGYFSCLVHYPCLAIDCYQYSSLSRSRCSEGGFGLLGEKGIVNGKTSTIFYILTLYLGEHHAKSLVYFINFQPFKREYRALNYALR
jgi:hypothetical protein